MSRTSTVGSNTGSSSSAAEISEFGERVTATGKVEMRTGLDAKLANVTERGRFGFLRKSKTIHQTVPGVAADQPPCLFRRPFPSQRTSIHQPIRFRPHESPIHPILYHHLSPRPLPALHIAAYLPLPPRRPNCASQTSSARVKRRTRGQNRSPNLLARNPTVLRTTGYPLHLERGPWSKVPRNLRRLSDDTSVRVRLPTKPIFSISRIMNTSERGVCPSRYPLCSASCGIILAWARDLLADV
ncbi:hypothetical protein EDB87DRAFT_857813 [Lactarius vividus]|nr:hypothetical protein EDB87DRAFT_857813 [Lactarius vividus]